jgi:putative ABC transport system permease protein
MLELKKICKQYRTGSLVQNALIDIDLAFRDNEFVAILGHSGSGKTTLLNIIGGLDQMSSGDLIINGISTRKYKDKDWDAYRNHSIGFVFQSYNLIPHQTILANVELSLTLNGIKRRERVQRAKKALESVGLADHMHKLPNQLSGGQMQRVAIARALVNDPDIILADEPTGALDSETSLQVMDILKQVAKDKLVIMVTHNPDLADEYANRIIRLSDGHIIDDSNPFIIDTATKPGKKIPKNKSMSLVTAFSLSLKNLLTKKLRTFMMAFAGSIGIMGIALILSVSTGFSNYIDQIQEETLSSYPLTITSESVNLTTMMTSLATTISDSVNSDAELAESQILTNMFAQVGTNNIKAFKYYYEHEGEPVYDDVVAVQYTYPVTPTIYSTSFKNGVNRLNPSSLMAPSSAMRMMGSFTTGGIFYEMLDNQELLQKQYDVLAGRWPKHYDEVLLVLNNPNTITDYMLYSLGLRDPKEFREIMEKVSNGESVENKNKAMEFEYEDFIGMQFALVNPAGLYRYNEEYNIYEDMSSDQEYVKQYINDSEKLQIVGIVVPKEGSNSRTLTPGIAYTNDLTEHVFRQALTFEIIQKQLNDPDTDVFSGKTFKELEDDSSKQTLKFEDMISVDTNMLAQSFKIQTPQNPDLNIDQQQLLSIVRAAAGDTGTLIKEKAEKLTPKVENSSKAITNAYFAMLKGIYIEEEQSVGYISLEDYEASVGQFESSNVYDGLLEEFRQTSTIAKDKAKPVFDNLIATMSSSYRDYYEAIMRQQDPEFELTSVMISDELIDAFLSEVYNREETKQSYQLIAFNLLQSDIERIITDEMASVFTKVITSTVSSMMSPNNFKMEFDQSKFAKAFSFNLDQNELSRIMSSYMNSDNTNGYRSNLIRLGYADIDDPTSMSIYVDEFEGKENFINFLDNYNDKLEAKGKKADVISYTDITGVLISGVKTIVDAVSYVLIAFVSISLVVSSIMIGVITMISVMERTKEIGVLRSIGASKKDIARIFNVETFIIGLLSGLIGVTVSGLLLIPINNLLHKLTGVMSLNAVLDPRAAFILVIISIMLTLIAGIAPSRSAANKNPVEALRTE